MGALKKPECKSLTKAINKSSDITNNVVQKAEIDRMKLLINEKIKDPELARKAAMIISEMLDKNTK